MSEHTPEEAGIPAYKTTDENGKAVGYPCPIVHILDANWQVTHTGFAGLHGIGTHLNGKEYVAEIADAEGNWPSGHTPRIRFWEGEWPIFPLWLPYSVDWYNREPAPSQANAWAGDATNAGLIFNNAYMQPPYDNGAPFPPDMVNYKTFGTTIESGDSGEPTYVMVDGEACFAGSHVYVGSDASAYVYDAMLDALFRFVEAAWNTWPEIVLKPPSRQIRWNRGSAETFKGTPEPTEPEPPKENDMDLPQSNWNEPNEGMDKLFDGNINTKGLTFGDMWVPLPSGRVLELSARSNTDYPKGPIVQLAGIIEDGDKITFVIANDTGRYPERNPWAATIWERDEESTLYVYDSIDLDNMPTQHGAEYVVEVTPDDQAEPQPSPDHWSRIENGTSTSEDKEAALLDLREQLDALKVSSGTA